MRSIGKDDASILQIVYHTAPFFFFNFLLNFATQEKVFILQFQLPTQDFWCLKFYLCYFNIQRLETHILPIKLIFFFLSIHSPSNWHKWEKNLKRIIMMELRSSREALKNSWQTSWLEVGARYLRTHQTTKTSLVKFLKNSSKFCISHNNVENNCSNLTQMLQICKVWPLLGVVGTVRGW